MVSRGPAERGCWRGQSDRLGRMEADPSHYARERGLPFGRQEGCTLASGLRSLALGFSPISTMRLLMFAQFLPISVAPFRCQALSPLQFSPSSAARASSRLRAGNLRRSASAVVWSCAAAAQGCAWQHRAGYAALCLWRARSAHRISGTRTRTQYSKNNKSNPANIAKPPPNCKSAIPQHLDWRLVRTEIWPHVRATLAAGATDKSRLNIHQPQIIGPSIGTERKRVASATSISWGGTPNGWLVTGDALSQIDAGGGSSPRPNNMMLLGVGP